MNKTYLGDGVYICTDEWGAFTLTTEDGIEITNEIYLEPAVVQNLLDYIKEQRCQ